VQGQDTPLEFLREARARRIRHHANSTRYDPVTGGFGRFGTGLRVFPVGQGSSGFAVAGVEGPQLQQSRVC